MGEFLVRKKSEIHGLGTFTNGAIKKGEVFYKVPTEYVYDYPEPRCAHIGNNLYVSDNKVLNWVNHSCEPNIKLDISENVPKLIAIRDIIIGEEITCNYDKTEIGGHIKIKCNCQSDMCRDYFMSHDTQ